MENGPIQRYQIKEKIGAGGMGTVYRAWDRELERDVALKWLPAYFSADETISERFKREIRVISHLEHPHIVPVYDIGESENRPFIIMRLLDGGTLRDMVTREDFNLAELVRATEEIADALAAAHDRQIIHRDIKPGNILFDRRGSAFLSDFGIAKVLDSSTQLTGAGFIGTPAYMSPEQFTGQAIDGRSDQYALAVVVYEALTGALPFEGDTARMMYQHINVSPPAIDLDQHPIPAGLNPILQKALSKDVDGRYANITDFSTALTNATRMDPATASILVPVTAGAQAEQNAAVEERVDSAGEEYVDETLLDPAMVAPGVDADQTTYVEFHPPTAAAVVPPLEKETGRKIPIWLIALVVVLLIGSVYVASQIRGGSDEGGPETLPLAGATALPAIAARAGSSTGDALLQPGVSGSGSVSTVASSPATAQPAAVRVVVPSTYLRDGPGTVYPIAGEIHDDTEVAVIATNNDRSWYNIELAGEHAWLDASVTEPVNAAAMNSVPLAATIPAAPLKSSE